MQRPLGRHIDSDDAGQPIDRGLDLKMRRYGLPAALDLLDNVLYCHDGDGTGVIITNPGQLEQGAGLHMVLLGRDRSHVQQQLAQVEEIFLEIGQGSTGTTALLH